MGQVLIGCSGWAYDSWRGPFYPAKEAKSRWLRLYAERFATVEINSTFYRLASRPAVERWVDETPEDFIFSVKASRYLTHMKRLVEIETGIERFYAPIEPLVRAGRLGPVLWQLPESFERDDARLGRWLELLPPGRHAIEFRHRSWLSPEVLAPLAGYDVAVVVADHPERPIDPGDEPHASWRFVRLHHGGGDGNYTEAALRRWAERIARWSSDGDVYVYLNNDWQAFAPRNALLLERLVAVAGAEWQLLPAAAS